MGRTGYALLAALMLVCFGLRYFAATTVPMPWEEAGLIDAADQISLAPGAANLPSHGWGRQPPGQLYLAKLGTLILGRNIVGFRFMSVVLGTASCWIMFALVRRVWGVWPALLALFLLCFNGFHIGVSRFAIERTYLFFSLLAIYLFWRGVGEGRPWLMVATGAVVGVGTLVSKHTLLLLPVFAVYLALSKANRCWLARWQPYVGLLVAVAICLPFVYVSLQSGGDGASLLEEDLRDHIERLGGLGLSAGPLTLYIPPLYHRLSGRVSLYPIMSVASGALLLGAALCATFVRRDEFSKLLLVVFWGLVAPFSLFASPYPEFKWAATSLFGAVPLAACALYDLFTRSRACAVLLAPPLAYMVGFAVWVASMSANCYYSPLFPPKPLHVAATRMFRGLETGSSVELDFPALVGSPLLPARYREYYLSQYLLVAELSDRGVMHPALMRPALERAAQIDAEHPDVHRLTSALARREAAGEATRYRTLAPGPQQLFLRSPLSALLGISQSEIDRELRGATITFMQRGPSPRDERPETGGGGPVSGGTARRQP